MKRILDDVVVMRLLLIVLLIVYHSFAPFCGSWESIGAGQTNDLYFWIGKGSYSFFLEAFVFISGLLTGYQSKTRPINEGRFRFIIKKSKRLLIPSIIFSFVYFMIFYKYVGWFDFIMRILSGCGHLWFLPMLFWCFLALWLFSYIQCQPIWILIIAVIGILISNELLPFRIGNSLYYFFFFYLGYLFPTHQNILVFFMRKSILVIMSILFLITFVICVKLDLFLNNNVGNILLSELLRIVRAVSSACGVLICYSIIKMRLSTNMGRVLADTKFSSRLSPFWIKLSSYAFGIYIMQQFILKILYYKTSFPLYVDYLLVPWIGTLIAVVLSILFTHLTLQTKVGRFLIG